MLFSQIYGTEEPRLTDEQMRQMRIDRWGTDSEGPRDMFSEDYSGKFNTELSSEDEAKYQAWAKENHREKDVYDYDLRGAWKELQLGLMSEDERGHLGDKYKKPNHPTFSDQSIYSGQDGVTGGVWSQNAEGKDVYTPGRKLSSVEADRLRRYFLRNEPGVVLDLKDKVLEERPLPGITSPLGWFSGLGDVWKGIPAGTLQTASSAITAFKNSVADLLSRVGTQETRDWWKNQQAVMDQNAKDIRDYNKANFEVDPETMGEASMIVHGLFKTLPKAMLLGSGLGVAGGALAFGADAGIDETNREMDEGVDQTTAIRNGLISFGMNSLGMRAPAVFGSSRAISALYGAGINAATNIAEMKGIQFILEHADYDQLAQQYDLNAVDMAVSTAMGAAFGAGFWRSAAQIRADKYNAAENRLAHEYNTKLLPLAQTGAFDDGLKEGDNIGAHRRRAAWIQAQLNARAAVALAKINGIEPDKIDGHTTPWDNAMNTVRRFFGNEEQVPERFAPNIVLTKDGTAFAGGEFHMPVTQGKEWHTGPQTIGRENEAVNVVHMNDVPETGRKAAIDTLAGKLSEGVKNSDSGWVLTGSRSDAKKTLPPFKFAEKNSGLYDAIVQNFEQIVSDAKLIESHVDIQNKNPDVRGIHKFAAAASYGGKNYRVQLIVRDYLPSAGGERLATHSIDAVEVKEIETAGGEGVIAPLAPTDATNVPPGATQSPGAGVSTAWSSADTVSLSDLLKGFVREDQRGAFDPIDDSYRGEGAAYYEPQEFNQIIGETGVRGMDAWDENWTRTNLLTVAKQMEMGGKTPEEIRAATGWERGADREWRYEIPDLNVKDGAAALVEEKRAAARKDGKKLFSVELADLVDAPDLFKAFSRFRNLKIEFGELPPRAGGYFAPEENAIRIPFDTDITTDGARMTLIHEIQHAIQEAEGFTKGADFSRVPTKGQALWRAMGELWRLRNNPDWQEYKDVDDALNRIYDEEATQARREKGITQAEDDAEADRLFKQVEALEKRPAVQAVLAEEKRLMKIYGSSEFDGVVLEAIKNASESPDDPLYESVSRWNPDFQMNAYLRVGGEVEARNAGRRAFMSPEDRAKKLLRDTEDVPRSERTRDGEFYQVAYHGSPYLFDKFSLDHVGEGVRAQWYGWGMYFSLDKNVARQYASNLYNASGEARDRYNRLSAEAERLQHELSAAEESGDMAVADGLRAQLTEAKAAVDKALPDHPRVYDAEIPEDSVMIRAATTIDKQPEIVQQAFRNLLGDVDGTKKGRALYNELAKKLGSKKAASEALRNEGVLGLRYSNSMDGECAVVWDDKAIEIREFLQKAKENGEIRGSFNPQTNTIKLTPNANLSTFSHEHSHWYLTNLFAHASNENLSPEARADINAILKAFGLNSIEEWNALPWEKKAKFQEEFAGWTERYLAEGKAPSGRLSLMFQTFAKWLMEMYRGLVGDGTDKGTAAKQEVNERFKAQFGEDLPEISKEVERILSRMYAAENKAAALKSTVKATLAARLVQSQRTNNRKVAAPLQNASEPAAYASAMKAQQEAADAMNTGEQVDVSQTMKNVPTNDAAIQQGQNAFAKTFQMGDTSSFVVLQNRDRTGVVSVGQMNAIATAPDYTRLSVSRTTDSGAPIVSYGSLPDSQYQGRTEIVADSTGKKIPMTYAVVEAESVLRSNNFDGTPVPEYGTDPSRVHAIAGNGRMAGLTEAYNRGTAEQYRQDLINDAQSVDIKPEVIAGMKHPVLVRYMLPEEVSTGFIERSNSSNVLEKSALEMAVQDSPRIRNNVWKYQFDEDGAPTPETVRQFTIDIGEPNALGKLLTADGRPTETATNRLRAAVFYEAYRDRTLTALVADNTDKQGIKRILNAMAAFAPHVINIREASNGAVDLGPILVDVVNRIRNAKIEGTPLESIIGQGDVFGDNPAVQQLLGFIAENQNSAAAIARVFEPFAAAVENRLKSSGNGPQAGLFGEAENVTTDLADVMGIFRDTQNRLIDEGNAAMREKGATEGFRETLPAVDVAAMRNTLQAMQKAEKPAENVVKSVAETVAEDVGAVHEPPPDLPPDNGLDAEAKAAADLEARQAHETEGLSEENSERVQVEDLAELNPDFIYKFKDEEGNEYQKTAKEILEMEADIDKQADADIAGLATAAMCIIRNNGIPA